MIFGFLVGLITPTKDWEYCVKNCGEYRKSVKFGRWVRINILRVKK